MLRCLILVLCIGVCASSPPLAAADTPTVRKKSNRRYLMPTLSVAVGLADTTYFHSWIGASLIPSREAVTPFLSAGLELDIRSYEDGDGEYTALEVRPTVRAGISIYAASKPWILPVVSVYGIAGSHRRPRTDERFIRTGIGLSSPAGTFILGHARIPAMVELVTDRSDETTEHTLRLGWNF